MQSIIIDYFPLVNNIFILNMIIISESIFLYKSYNNFYIYFSMFLQKFISLKRLVC